MARHRRQAHQYEDLAIKYWRTGGSVRSVDVFFVRGEPTTARKLILHVNQTHGRAMRVRERVMLHTLLGKLRAVTLSRLTAR